MDDRRDFDNPFEDFSSHRDTDVLRLKEKQIQPVFLEKLQESSNILLERLETEFSKSGDHDYSIYTGSTGIALVYYLLACKRNNRSYLMKSTELVESALPRLKCRRVSFLGGDAGPLALGAVVYAKQARDEQSSDLVRRLKLMLPSVIESGSDIPDEVLYGRTGYLYALLFIKKNLGEEVVGAETIRQVVAAVLHSGQALAKREKRNVPLMYMWHDKYYLGAAHGLCGILYMLLQARDYLSSSELNTLVKPTIDYLMGIRFHSGNFPSSLGNNSDKLIHWCHGAPGMVHLFCLAHQVFGDNQYNHVAVECGEVIWKRGILRKGYGICHGVSGNAYAFLHLFQITKDPKYLHRACKFAEWCTSYGQHQCRTPDRPLSLFEGLAGAIYMMVDIEDPLIAKFPAFSV